MLIYKTLETASAVLSACTLPADAASAHGAPRRALLNRLNRFTSCVACPDGIEVQHDLLLSAPAVAIAPLPYDRALVIQQDGGSAVVDLSQPLPEGCRARMVAHAAPSSSTTGLEGAQRDAGAFNGCICSVPLSIHSSGSGGSSSSGSSNRAQTFVLVSRMHGVLQLVCWSGAEVASASGPSGSCSSSQADRGRLDVVSFRATHALLTGGLPGEAAVADHGMSRKQHGSCAAIYSISGMIIGMGAQQHRAFLLWLWIPQPRGSSSIPVVLVVSCGNLLASRCAACIG